MLLRGMVNNRWCPNLFLFWCTVHFTQSSKRNTVFSCVMSGMSCVCIWMVVEGKESGQDWVLQQGARGALWRRWGVCWAVAHWQDVIVAGNVAVPREVIWTLWESARQAVGSLKNTHCRFWGRRVAMGERLDFSNSLWSFKSTVALSMGMQ